MLANRAGVLILTIISSALSARALGPAGRGGLAVALSFALILAQVANLGLTSANPYFASREPAARAQIVTNTLWLVVAISSVVTGLGVGVAALAPSLIRGVSTGELALALAVVPATLAMTSLQA